ncbi:hypothetical protein [Leptolyngbya sp. NIES-2104]|uniref:hypothetical protein n=1 Tax=Leptolyngbya sp. NIES-2104 TaxID=1552121 RepID=UPI0006EC727B|nr:hypothetical protein [Leptolyngbya sp. NIES-2104]GAP93907.1 hypothetical protein NIES2104_04160 [Leptolyngbya sp. NIES-2104]
MKLGSCWTVIASSTITVACQPNAIPSATQSVSIASQSDSSSVAQVISPNAYKVPYLGYNGTFMLNTEQESSIKDPRNPKRIGISKMEKITFYKDAAGKSAIARNCHYIYMGAAPDPKYYQAFKATWDLFELANDEDQDPNCKRFQYLTLTAPHDEPIHMHVRYGNDQSSFATLLRMSTNEENAAQFSPWFATYCGGGKTKCGKG